MQATKKQQPNLDTLGIRVCERWHVAAAEVVRSLEHGDSETDYDRREPVRMVAIKQAGRYLMDKMRCPDCREPIR